MSKNKYDEFNLPPTGPNLCDFYGQYIGFGGGNGGASGVAVDALIAKSALYISGDNARLNRTPSSAGNRDIWTFSTWVFRTLKNAEEIIFNAGADDNNRTTIKFNANNIQYFHFDGGGVTDVLTTNAVMRDLGWLHLVVAVDTTEAIEINRVIIYVNGVRITSYSTANYPAQNADTDFNSTSPHVFGSDISGSNDLDVYLAESVFIDGTQLKPTSFGEYDTSNLYWTPLSPTTIKALTFGTNGFYLSNENSTSQSLTSFTDDSSTGHTITAAGNTTYATTQVKTSLSSISFDGNGDHLKWAQSGHSDFTLGTADMCIEGWFYRDALSGTSNISYIIDFRYAGNNDDRPAIYMDGSNNINYDLNGIKITSSTDPSIDEWFHLAVARVSGTTTMYLNGTAVGNFSDAVDYLVGRPWLGDYPQSNAYAWTGFMDEVRISKGAARHTGNFTPTTTPLVSDTNTSFLLRGIQNFGAGHDANSDPGQGNHLFNASVILSTHTPTNVYATLNPLMAGSPGAFTQGNRTATIPPVNSSVMSTLPFPPTGKWYCEVKFATIHGYSVLGVSQMNASTWLENSAEYISPATPTFTEEGTLFTEGDTSGDSIAVAADTIYGVMWSSDESILKITDGTNTFQCAYTVNDIGLVGTVPLGWIFAISSGSVTGVVSVNFGDPPFTISSGNTDGNGHGNFEFAPPDGYLALNTANIAANSTRTASDITKYFEPILYEGNGTAQRVGPLQPFGNSFTVAKSALFNGDDNSLSRTQVAGTSAGTVWTFSAWIKNCVTKNTVFVNWSDDSAQGQLGWDASGNFYLYDGSTTVGLTSREVSLDKSQWSHYHVAYNTGESGTDKAKLTINGVLETNWATDNRASADAFQGVGINNEPMIIGNNASAGGDAISLNGYMAQVVFLDGTASAASNFGQLDTTTNRWIPSDLSSFSFGSGNNTVFLDFADSDALGDDESGQGHDFTNNNTVVQSADSPTSNFNTYDPSESSGTFSTGNTISLAGNNSINIGTLPLYSGKWVFEATGTTDSLVNHFVGVAGPLMPTDNGGAQSGFSDGYMLENDDGSLWIDGADSGLDASATWTTDDVIRLEIDRDNHTLQWFKNGSSILSIKNVYDKNWRTATSYATFMATTMNSGASSFAGTPTSGFLAISQDNMASTNQFISAFSWTKNRDAADDYLLMDRVRGVNKYLHSDDAAVEVTNVETVQRFLKGGIQIGDDVEINTANESYVSWNWYMPSTGSGSSNTDGSINTTSTLVDTTLGLSISTYTGTGSNATVGHGLGAVPRLIFIKNRGVTDSWAVYYGDNTDYLVLDTATGTVDDATMWQDTTPTSTVWSIGTNHQVNADGENYIAYCFANSQFISVGEFLGNENTNGPYVSTVNSLGVPIQPTFVMIKNMSKSRSWNVWDNKRSPFNVSQNLLEWDFVQTEQTGSTYFIDIVTGGFKPRGTHETINGAEQMLYFAMGSPIIDTSGRIIAGKL